MYDYEEDPDIYIAFVGRYEVTYYNRRTQKRWTEYSTRYIR